MKWIFFFDGWGHELAYGFEDVTELGVNLKRS